MSGLILHLSILQSHVFLLNSRLGHFTAAPLRGHPFSRSYRVNLPSSLAMDHSSTLGFSPRLPVSVCGTGSTQLKLTGFSRKLLYNFALPEGSAQRAYPSARSCYVSPSPDRIVHWYRNINLLSINFAVRLRLRTRLTLIRLTLIRKP